MSVLKDSEGRVLLDDNGAVKLTNSIKSVKANGVNNYADTEYGTNANSVMVANGKFNSNGTTQSVGARGATTGRFFFNKQSTGEWALGWGDSALVGGISDTELHTFILYDKRLWVVNKVDDLINNQSELINIINSTTPTISLTANWVVFSQSIFIGARNYFGTAETFADFTHYETLISEYDGIIWTDKHYFTNYTPSKLRDNITGNIVEWQGSTPLLYSLDLASPDRKPLFALSANYRTRFDETNAKIVKADAGNEVVFLPVAGSQVPVIEDGGILFDHLLTSKLKASKVPVNIDFTNFTKQIKIKLNSATGNDFTIFKIGEEVGTNNIALMIYVDSQFVWFRVKKSASFSTFGIDVSAIDINNPLNITFGVKNQTAYLSCANYFKKITLGEDIDTFYATQMFAGGIYSDVEIVNGFLLYETRWYNTSVIDPANYVTNSEFADIAINNIKPPSILPPQPLYELRGDNRVYGTTKPAVDKWVCSKDSGTVFKSASGTLFGYSNYDLPQSLDGFVDFSTGNAVDYADLTVNFNEDSFCFFGFVNFNTIASPQACTRIGVADLTVEESNSNTLLKFGFNGTYIEFVLIDNANNASTMLTDAVTGLQPILFGYDNGTQFWVINSKIYKTATGFTGLNVSNLIQSIGMDLVLHSSAVRTYDGSVREMKYYPYQLFDLADYANGADLPYSELYKTINRIEGVEISHRDGILNTGNILNSIRNILSRIYYARTTSDILIRNNYIEQTVDNTSAETLYEEVIPAGSDLKTLTFSGFYNITTAVSSIDYFNVNFVRIDGTSNFRKGYAFRTTATGDVNLLVYSGAVEIFSMPVDKNKLLHVLLTINKNNWAIYVDGKKEGSGANMNTVYSQDRYFIANRMKSKFTDIKIESGIQRHINFVTPTRSIK